MNTKSSVLNWLESKGIKKDEFLVDVDSAQSKAIRSIKKGENLCTIPLSICLDPSTASSRFGSSISAAKFRTGDIGILALILLYEKSLGEKSKYSDYISSLPSVPPGILSWSDADLEELSRSTTRRVMSQIQAVQQDFDTLLSLSLSSLSLFCRL